VAPKSHNVSRFRRKKDFLRSERLVVHRYENFN
jgi:hypothetical protein